MHEGKRVIWPPRSYSYAVFPSTQVLRRIRGSLWSRSSTQPSWVGLTEGQWPLGSYLGVMFISMQLLCRTLGQCIVSLSAEILLAEQEKDIQTMISLAQLGSGIAEHRSPPEDT